MKSITKKRTKAFLIDLAISTAVTAGVEYVLRKKVKNEDGQLLPHDHFSDTVVKEVYKIRLLKILLGGLF